jgi:hypothetical protein
MEISTDKHSPARKEIEEAFDERAYRSMNGNTGV